MEGTNERVEIYVNEEAMIRACYRPPPQHTAPKPTAPRLEALLEEALKEAKKQPKRDPPADDLPFDLPPLLEKIVKADRSDNVEEALPIWDAYQHLCRLDKCQLCGGIGHSHTLCPLLMRLNGYLDAIPGVGPETRCLIDEL